MRGAQAQQDKDPMSSPPPGEPLGFTGLEGSDGKKGKKGGVGDLGFLRWH